MAPVSASQSCHDMIEKQLKDVIQDIFQIMLQVNTYDQVGRPGKGLLEMSVNQLSKTLSNLYRTALSSTNQLSSNPTASQLEHQQTFQLPHVPPELIQYVDNGRNPDIYTREFVELARKSNQLMKGKIEAFSDFRDTLAGEMCKALPELEADIASVLERTGGDINKLKKQSMT